MTGQAFLEDVAVRSPAELHSGEPIGNAEHLVERLVAGGTARPARVKEGVVDVEEDDLANGASALSTGSPASLSSPPCRLGG